MPGYITGFAVYTLAMTGILFLAFIIAKKCMILPNGRSKNNFLQVENYMSLDAGKGLYVVKAGRERFLIASSRESCQFMTKLEEHSFVEDVNKGIDSDIKVSRDFIPALMPNIDEELPKKDIIKQFKGVF
jgi:flagellar biogenesis protein FliO